MKLLKYQIEALASELSQKNLKVYQSERAKNRKDKFIIALAQRYMGILSKIPTSVRNELGIYTTEKTMVVKMADKRLKTPKPVSYNDLKRQISIASIEAKDLTDLKKKIGL